MYMSSIILLNNIFLNAHLQIFSNSCLHSNVHGCIEQQNSLLVSIKHESFSYNANVLPNFHSNNETLAFL